MSSQCHAIQNENQYSQLLVYPFEDFVVVRCENPFSCASWECQSALGQEVDVVISDDFFFSSNRTQVNNSWVGSQDLVPSFGKNNY